MKVYGINAVVARREAIGQPIKGEGSICQDVPEESLTRIALLAAVEGKRNAKVRESRRGATNSAPVKRAPYSYRPDYSRHKVTDRTHQIVRAMLKAARGIIPHHTIIKACHDQGLGCTNEIVAAERSKLGLPTDSRASKAKLNGHKPASEKAQQNPAQEFFKDEVSTVAEDSNRVVIPAWSPASPPMWSPISPPRSLSTSYLRECVIEWNRRVAAAQEIIDLGTDPLVPAKEE